MKQKIFLFISLLVSTFGFAQTFTDSGINYTITNAIGLTVAVDTHTSYTGVATIPSTVSYNSKNYAVTTIGDIAFQNCTGLTSVSIPASVTTIETSAFQGCTGLTSVSIPNSVTTIRGNAFQGCTGLTSVSIPTSVTSIGTAAFFGCTGLTSVSIPASVTSIGTSAFSDCTGLISVNIPASVTSIGTRTFYGCIGLTSVSIPNSVTTIGGNAFQGCTGLISVNIPNSVTTIETSAFQGCTGLTSVSIPNSVTTIGNNAFQVCTGLTWVSIPTSVTTIGNIAFAGCTGLTSVSIPNSVTSIGNSAFQGCTGLISVSISNSVASIGTSVFLGCTGLTSVGIPNSVTSIGASAFRNCTGLTSVSIPASVTSIGASAFSGCTGLKTINCNIVTPLTISANVFQNVNKAVCFLNVPAVSEANYKATTVWKDFIILETNTWNGTVWDKGTPTSSSKAIINGNYSEAVNLIAYSLDVTGTAVVTVPTGYNFNISEKVTVAPTASLTFENNANLIQIQDIANNGNITSKRNSASLMLLDYTLWSSPVSGQKLQEFSQATLPNRFYVYNPTTDLYNATTPTANFTTGKSYLIRMPNNHPITPTIWNGSFTGVPNNGTVSLTVANDTYNAIGNPYPSTIDADDFIDENNLTEALYFWRKTNGTANTSYATYTKAGGTANAGGFSSIVPNGTLQVGQGFIAKSTSTALTFTNAMRTANNANQFLRTKAPEKHRIWLNLSGTSGQFNQTMVAYMNGATTGIDAKIDGRFINDSSTALNSNINNEEFVIQGKGLPFEDTDIVPLAFKTKVDGNYTISIDHVDGLFLGNQDIFLKDNLTGIAHNIKQSGYSFASAKGIFNDRFQIVYKNSGTLGTDSPELNDNEIIVFKQNGLLNINAGSVIIKNVKLFDVRGRLLFEQKDTNNTAIILKGFTAAQQAIIIQITSNENKVITKKVVY